MVHLAGPDVVVEGRWVRQLCQWCGYRLVDMDLTLCQVPEGQGPPPMKWEVGKWIGVEGVNPTSFTIVEPPGDGLYPAGACFSDVVPILKEVQKP